MDRESIERQVLGSVMLNFNLVDKFLSKLNVKDFVNTYHQECYNLFKVLVDEGINEFSIGDVYASHPDMVVKCGHIEYLVGMYDDVHSLSTFDSSIRTLIKLSTITHLNNLPSLASKYFNKNFNDGIDFVDTYVSRLLDRSRQHDSVKLYDSFKASLDSKDVNVNLGFPSVHEVLGYPHPGELMIIGARPGMGKTSFALALLFNYITTSNKKAVMFSLEMSGPELFNKMVSSISAIPLTQMRAGKLTKEERKCLDDNAKELSNNKNLVLFDKTVSNVSALRAALRKESSSDPVGIVIVDYLQLLTGNGNSMYEKVSEISRQLKLLARDFNCTVIALSQLSRKVEDRSDKRPQLSDLRESGSIEQDADYVLFLYRHNYYVKDPSADPRHDPLNVEVSKNRHGKTGTVQLDFDLTTGRFNNSKED